MEKQQIVFTCHQKIAYIGFIGVIFFVAIIEGVGVSFLLHEKSPLLHYLHLALNLFLLLVLWVDTKKVITKPLWVEDETLHFTVGIRPKVQLSLDNIQEIRDGKVHYEELHKKKEVLDLALFATEEPTLEIVLKEPVCCKALLGKKRNVSHIFFFIDEKEKFISLINEKKKTAEE